MGCFDDTALEAFLAGRAERGFERSLDLHLRGCQACRDRLDRLCADPLVGGHVHRNNDPGPVDRPGSESDTDAVVRSWSEPLKAAFLAPPVSEATGEGTVGDSDALPVIPGLELRRRIGAGGMGVVFEAFDPHLKRRVAVKMLRGFSDSPESSGRLRREAEAAARINHPGIVQVYGFGETDGQPWILLEFVDGTSLTDRLGGRPHPPREAAALALTLAEALAVAHRHHIVHRDLKPSNVLLATAAAETPLSAIRPKIADFGLAKVLDGDSAMTREGQLVGTPTFAAPEQLGLRETRIGPQADVYSLGAILYTTLVGLPPLQSDDTWRTVRMVLEDEPVAPRRLQPGVPIDLETICLRCLAKDPARRYRDAGDVADDLRRFLAHEPIRARPVGLLERVSRWARREPALAGTTAALALMLSMATVGAVVAAFHFWALEQERDGERLAAERALADSRRTLAESLRTIGLRLQSDHQNHLAPICFATAAGLLPPDDPLRSDNEIRAASALRAGPRPAALLGEPAGPALRDVRFHPSGRWLAAVPLDDSLATVIWSLDTATELRLPGPLGEPGTLAWDRSGDRIVVGTRTGKVLVGSFPGGEPIGQFDVGAPVVAVTIAPSGDRVAAATADTIRWRSVGTPTPIGPVVPPARIDGEAAEVDFSPDGRHLVLTTRERQMIVHRIDAPSENGPLLVAGCGRGAAADVHIRPQFDPGGRVVAWSDDLLSWYDLDRGTVLRTEAFPAARFCEVSPSSGDVVLGGERHFKRYWDSGSEGFSVDTRASACWLPDGGILTGGAGSDTLIRWTPDFEHGNGWPLFQPDGVTRMRLSPDGRYLATISAAHRLRLWRMPADRETVRAIPGGGGVSRVGVSPDGSRLLVHTDRDGLLVRPALAGEGDGSPTVIHGDVVDAVWSDGGRGVVTLVASPEGATIERRSRDGEASFDPPLRLPMLPARTCPDRHHLLAVPPTGPGLAFVTDAPADLVITGIPAAQGAPVRVGIPARYLVAGSVADRLVVVAGEDAGNPDQIAVVEWRSGRVTCRHRIPGVVNAIAAAGGDVVAVADQDHRIWLLETATGAIDAPTLPHPNQAVPEALSADGRLLLTSGGDRNLRLWDWRRSRLVMPPASFPRGMTCTLAARDRVIVLVRDDGFCHFLGTSDGLPLCPPFHTPDGEFFGTPTRTTFSASAEGDVVALGSDAGVLVIDLTGRLARAESARHDLAALSRLVTGHHLVDGRPIPLDVTEWDTMWRDVAPATLQRAGDHEERRSVDRGRRGAVSEGDGTRTRGLQRDRLAL